ncbi:polyprenyl synthetase family protein [Streptomyces sp. NPDC050636]|uniref:polyprenyl synthetase family protein n=1 Tax=Streptomyces sp. NPDC050636 TaxID=3154510 RepID=UPI00341B6324
MTTGSPFPASDDITALAVPDLLAQAHRHVGPALRRAVSGLHPELHRICGYHFGWFEQDGSPASGAACGKAMRACLVLLSAASPHPDHATALQGAAAVELLHNWTMLHDDVMDGDKLRRGRATAWSVYGTDWAVLTGDALWAAANRCLLLADGQGAAALALLMNTAAALINGQAADLDLTRRTPASIAVDEYATMAAGKTSALLECALGIGAALGGASEPTVQQLQRAGHYLGIAWQAANDIEDIWSDPAVTGKPAMNDLRERKPTLPLIAALHTRGAAAHTLARAVREGAVWPPPHDLAVLIEQAGGRAAAQSLSDDYLATALAHLDRSGLPPDVGTAMKRLFRFIVTRA